MKMPKRSKPARESSSPRTSIENGFLCVLCDLSGECSGWVY
jgi:hypothetical protein